MAKVRLGIVGIGNMGTAHSDNLLKGAVPDMELAAICDRDEKARAKFPDAKLERFADASSMIKSGKIDAILIATPHYDHTTIGIEALQAGLHVLVEKPISVHVADCNRLTAAATRKDRVFAAMFNQRTDPKYQKLRSLIQNGELGEIRRINWIITDWFRTATYYSSGGWRATWEGEGGGVLLNQCPHNLDLIWWLFGKPKKVHAFGHFGRYHDIEVEDDVTAYMEYEGGKHLIFTTTTGETPGTNRLEVVAERGKVVLEGRSFQYTRNEVPMAEFCATSPASFARPDTWNVSIDIQGGGEQHVGIMKNFAAAILRGEKLLSPAPEGVHSVELANSMILSMLEKRPVELPLDAAHYEKVLQGLIAESKKNPRKKKVVTAAPADMSGSFGK